MMKSAGGQRSTRQRKPQCLKAVLCAVGAFAVYMGWYLLVHRPFIHTLVIGRLDSLMVKTESVLRRCGVEYVIDSGTLLGVYRDHALIRGDTDVDLKLTSWVERTKVLQCAPPLLEAEGLRIDTVRNPWGGVKILDHDGIAYCDVDTAEVEGDSLVTKTLPYCQPKYIDTGTHAQYCRQPRDLVLPLAAVTYRGRQVPVPADAKAILLTEFGATWATPRAFDKGADTTAWDSFKSNVGIFLEMVWVWKYTAILLRPYLWAIVTVPVGAVSLLLLLLRWSQRCPARHIPEE